MKLKLDNLKAIIDLETIDIEDIFDIESEEMCTVFIRINGNFIKELNGFKYRTTYTNEDVIKWATKELTKYIADK